MVQERRSPVTSKVAGMILAHKNDPNAHHVPGGGANVKSGAVSGASGSVTFNTAFSSTPQVVMISAGGAPLRDAIFQVTAVNTTGFSWEADISQDGYWISPAGLPNSRPEGYHTSEAGRAVFRSWLSRL